MPRHYRGGVASSPYDPVALGAVVTTSEADLLVIPSRAEASPGQLLLSSKALEDVEMATCPVLLLARGATLGLG